MTKDMILYSSMRTALKKWVDMTDTQWNKFSSIFNIKNVPKDKYILLPGDKTYDLIFVYKGLMRIYYIDKDGEESNKAFVAENMLAGPLATALLKMPSRYGIQVLEPSILLAANYADYFKLLEEHTEFDRIGRKFLEWVLGQRELREQSLLQQTPTERYIDFIKQNGNIIQRIPQYHIASYLGITDVSLSRLRQRLAKANSNSIS